MELAVKIPSVIFVGMSAIILGSGGLLSAGIARGPSVGAPAPDFQLPGTDGMTHRLSDNSGKYVVLAWFTAAFTDHCYQECKSLQDSRKLISEFDVACYMASVDSTETNYRFAQMDLSGFPLLSDPKRTTALAYGVVSTTNPTDPRSVPPRWTFYIGPSRRILYIDKQIRPETAGSDVVKRLIALGVARK